MSSANEGDETFETDAPIEEEYAENENMPVNEEVTEQNPENTLAEDLETEQETKDGTGEELDEELDGAEKVEGEHVSEAGDGEQKDEVEDEQKVREEQRVVDEQIEGEELQREEEEEKVEEEQIPQDAKVEEVVEEEETEYVEEPVDPAAPLNLSDSKEAVRAPFELRPEQLAEVERLWEIFQDYTPAYTDIDGYITLKELVYMLKSLLLMTYTEEQLMELVTFVCRPPNEEGHITYEQFLRMVTIRQRDFDIEEELREALRVLDPGRTGEVESDELQEVLGKLGNKLQPKILNEFIKEIDLSGEGKIGIEDVVAICGMDLRKDDMLMGPLEPEEDDA